MTVLPPESGKQEQEVNDSTSAVPTLVAVAMSTDIRRAQGQILGVSRLLFQEMTLVDPATRENGCMEFVRHSHRHGPVRRVSAANIDLCPVRPDHLRLASAFRSLARP